jgi:exodeoxyribonuclease VII small subunit
MTTNQPEPTGTTGGDAAGDRTGDGTGDLADELGYADALGELEAILRELEGADVDVDRLAAQVERAAQLIAVCRERIGRARLRIDGVVADLDAAADASGAGAQGDARPPDPA